MDYKYNLSKEIEKGTLLKVYVPHARVLYAEEINALPCEKRKAAEESSSQGLWIEVVCPDDACQQAGGRISIPIRAEENREKKGFWLKFFCPEDACEISKETYLA